MPKNVQIQRHAEQRCRGPDEDVQRVQRTQKHRLIGVEGNREKKAR